MKTQYHPPALCDNAVWVTDFNPKVMNVVCSILRENRQTLGKQMQRSASRGLYILIYDIRETRRCLMTENQFDEKFYESVWQKLLHFSSQATRVLI